MKIFTLVFCLFFLSLTITQAQENQPAEPENESIVQPLEEVPTESDVIQPNLDETGDSAQDVELPDGVEDELSLEDLKNQLTTHKDQLKQIENKIDDLTGSKGLSKDDLKKAKKNLKKDLKNAKKDVKKSTRKVRLAAKVAKSAL